MQADHSLDTHRPGHWTQIYLGQASVCPVPGWDLTIPGLLVWVLGGRRRNRERLRGGGGGERWGGREIDRQRESERQREKEGERQRQRERTKERER